MINLKYYKIETYILIENAVLFDTNHNILLKLGFLNEKVTKIFQCFFEFLKHLPKIYFNTINRKSKKAQDVDFELRILWCYKVGFCANYTKKCFFEH